MKSADKISKILARVAKYYKVEPAHSAKSEELVCFFKTAYADQFNAAEYQNEKSVMERREWSDIRNPNKYGIQSLSWICRENKSDRIVGYFGIMPVSLKYRNFSYPAVWGRDLIILPEFRRLGIGPFLIDSVLKEIKNKAVIFLIAGLNDHVHAIYKKLGFIDMGYIPLYVRINRLNQVIRSKINNRLLASLLNILGGKAVKIIYIPSQILRYIYGRKKDISITGIAYFDNSFNKLWENASASFGLIVRRDTAYLNWRFVNQPYRKYKIFKAFRKDSDTPIGYIVLREGMSQGLRVGVITEIFAAANDSVTIVSLLNFAISYFAKKNEVVLLRCNMLNRDFGRALKKCGFINIQPTSHFMFANVSRELDAAFFANRNNWFLDYADSDLDLSG